MGMERRSISQFLDAPEGQLPAQLLLDDIDTVVTMLTF